MTRALRGLALGLLVCCLAWPRAGRSQTSDPNPAISPALQLARLCVSEAGWSCFRLVDGRAIHEAISLGAARRQSSWAEFAVLYAPRLLGNRAGDRTERLQWVAELDGDEQPEHWPSRAVWSRYIRRWLEVRKQASYLMNLSLAEIKQGSTCDGPAHDWSAPGAQVRLGHVEVFCGVQVRNRFFMRRALARPGLSWAFRPQDREGWLYR